MLGPGITFDGTGSNPCAILSSVDLKYSASSAACVVSSSSRTKIDKMHTQLDARTAHQWTYSYSPKVRSLMRQLEIPVRHVSAQPSDALLKALAAQNISPNMFEQMAERDENLIAKLSAAFSDALANALKTVQQPKSK